MTVKYRVGQVFFRPLWRVLLSIALTTGFTTPAFALPFVNLEAQAPPAPAPIKVFLDFTNSGLTDFQQMVILTNVREKFNFTVDGANVADKLEFTTVDPGGNAHRIIFDNRLIASDFGSTTGNESTVFRRKLTEGHFRNFFPTAAEQIASLVDTAAHELAHQLMPGVGHNMNAPSDRTIVTDANGDRYQRRAGNGTLINGRPGLMADGRAVIPQENAADLRAFTDEEKKKIATSLMKEQQGQAVKPAPSGKQSDLQFIEGIRFDPEAPDPSAIPPFPLDREDQWVDLAISLAGNSVWDFGFATADGGFVSLVDAGQPGASLAFEPGAVVDFAIRMQGLPDAARLAMSQIGTIESLSDVVSPDESVVPMVDGTYFRFAVLSFDPDGDSTTPGVTATLRMDQVDMFDGFRSVSVPEPSTLILAGGGALLLLVFGWRHRRYC